MASSYSFDVVSDFDYQEVVNAVEQTRRDVENRYDLKDSKTQLDLSPEKLTIETASQFTLDAVITVLHTKAAKRDLSLKIFEAGKLESASGGRVRQDITLKKGLTQENAKKISKSIRDSFPKIQASIQGDALRVTGKSKDDLQEVMQLLRQGEWPVALQFTNYR